MEVQCTCFSCKTVVVVAHYWLLQFVYVMGRCLLLQRSQKETKFSSSLEELTKLVESAQSGALEPGRLSDILAAVSSSAVRQDSRSQLLMQLILLIQQQLAAAETNSTVTENSTANPPAVVRHDDDNLSPSSSISEKPHNVKNARKLPSDIETSDADNENEMDKLLAWKNRIQNASATSDEEWQSSGTVVDQSPVGRHVITDPASPDAHAETASEPTSPAGDDTSTYSPAASSDVSSCVVTTLLPSCGSAELSPASPLSADYPPLPTPPKPPDNLLMRDRADLSSELFAPPLPFLPVVNSAPSVVVPAASADAAACLPLLSVPVSTDTAVSFDKLAAAPSDVCAWPPASAVRSSQSGSYRAAIITSDAEMPLETFSCNASRESIDSSSMERLSALNCVSESAAYRSDVSNSTFSPLNSVLDDPRGVLHTVTTRSQEPCFRQSRATRLKSPSAWMSRLASPSAFMLQSGVSRVEAVVNECPAAMCSSHKQAGEQASTTEPMSHLVQCGQRMPFHQQRPACTDGSRHSVHNSALFRVSHSEVGGQSTLGDRRVRGFDNVSSYRSQEGPDTEYGTVINSQLSAREDMRSDGGTVRLSTDQVLMRLAEMLPADSDITCADEPRSQTVHGSNAASAGDCAMESFDETGASFVSSRAVDEVPCATVPCAAVCRAVDEVPCATLPFAAVCRAVDEVPCATVPCAGVSRAVDEQSASSAVAVESPQEAAAHELHATAGASDDDDDDLEEGEIVDDYSPTPAANQRDLPQATKQLLQFLKTDPMRNSSSSQLVQPRASAGQLTYRQPDDRREDVYKYHRSNSSSRRR